MATSAPTPLRQVLEERVKQLVLETESLFADARDRARREMADQLNQAVRRIRQASTVDDLGATLVDATAAFCPSAALFRVVQDELRGLRIRGVAEAVGTEFAGLHLPLQAAPALAGAVESRDPVVTATTAGEVSAEVAKLLDHNAAGRAAIYPVVARDGVEALLYTWGAAASPATELLAQTASLMWTMLEEPVAAARVSAPELVTIAAAAPVKNAKAAAAPVATTWDQLPAEEQRVHLKAQRFARVQVSEMRLFEAEAVQSGRAHGDLYDALRRQIDGARETYRTSFFVTCSSMVDYLHLELVRTLANDKPELLGGEYPGPLV